MKTHGGTNLTRDCSALGLAAHLACWAETTEAVGSGGPSHSQNGRPAHTAHALARVTAHSAARW
jgi:hypothetical protein